MCRKEISKWKRNNRPSSAVRIQELHQKIDQVTRHVPFNQTAMISLKQELNEEYHHEEIFWKQKSRLTWMNNGDKNTKFFNAATKNRRAQNQIHCLVDDEEKEWYAEKDLGRVAESYFKMFFTSEDVGFELEEMSEVTSVVNEKMNAQLLAPVTVEEVKKAVFAINPSKSPGPDGMTDFFFQQFWESMGGHLTTMVTDFFSTGKLEPCMNREAVSTEIKENLA